MIYNAKLERRLEAIAPSVQLLRHGRYLLARENAVFPDRCLITNVPTPLRFRVSFSWMLRSPRAQRRVAARSTIVILVSIAVMFMLPFFTRQPWFQLFGFLLYVPAFVYSHRSQRIRLDAPFCAKELARYRRTVLTYMTVLALTGILYPLAGILQNYWFLFIGAIAQLHVILVSLTRNKLVSANGCVEGFVQLEGVSAEFLQAVPDVYAAEVPLDPPTD